MAEPVRIHLVQAQWEHEGTLPLVTFKEPEEAAAFAAKCEEHQKLEPEDDCPDWETAHPASPYLESCDHLYGVESFPVVELNLI